MKKLVGLIAAGLFVMGAARLAHADNFANIQLDVTLDSAMHVHIVGSSVTAFGTVAVNSSALSSPGIVVKNESPAVALKFGLKSYDVGDGTGGTLWTLSQNAGANAHALRAMFNSAAPATGDFSDADDGIFPNNTLIYATATKFAGDQSGASVGAGQSLTAWFKIFTPTSTTRAGTFNLTVTVQGDLL